MLRVDQCAVETKIDGLVRGGPNGFRDGVAQDDEEAVDWYRRAADQGHAEAQYPLGKMYAKGQSVARDAGEAVRDHTSWRHSGELARPLGAGQNGRIAE